MEVLSLLGGIGKFIAQSLLVDDDLPHVWPKSAYSSRKAKIGRSYV